MASQLPHRTVLPRSVESEEPFLLGTFELNFMSLTCRALYPKCPFDPENTGPQLFSSPLRCRKDVEILSVVAVIVAVAVEVVVADDDTVDPF